MVTASTIAKVNIDEVYKVNVLTDRVQKHRNESLAASQHICAEKCRLITQSWRETEGQPVVIRRARLFEKVLQGKSIVIRDDELIVGSQTKYVRGASPTLDYASRPFLELLTAEKLTADSEVVEAFVTEEEMSSLLEDARYWDGQAPGDVLKELVRETVTEQIDDIYEAHLFRWQFEKPGGGRSIDYDKVINQGINGVLREIREEIESVDLSVRGNWEKYEFLKAGIICCETLINFAHRYASLARALAERESDAVRKKELEKIAEVCQWVPANPARNFYEALQSFWFAYLAINLEDGVYGDPLGRMDQYLYPFYEKDISEGRITRQEAAELLGCLWVKCNDLMVVKAEKVQQFNQGSMFQDVTICGVTEDGKDATNELSFLILEVTHQMKMPQPAVYIRYHNFISDDLMVKAIETNRDHGAGIPCFINDAPMLLKLTDRGVPLKDARNWIAQGCIDMYIAGASAAGKAVMYNPAKVFELALNDGIDPRTGKQLGLKTGDPRKFKTYEELYDAFIKQFEYTVKLAAKVARVAIQARGELFMQPFVSILMSGCIESGKDFDQGGFHYPQVRTDWNYVGDQNVADGLTAIKKLVFDDKKLTMGEILDALAVNFEGKEELRQMLLAAPKYGNDDDYADDIWNSVYLDTGRIMTQERNLEGYPMHINRGGASGHWWAGKCTGALPDGRKAWEATADGNVSPVQGSDVRGPTAILLSATKVNQTEHAMSVVLNMKIMPAVVRTKEGIRKLLYLIKTYFDRGGWHVQFNMIDREILLEAQKHPEQHRQLMVRVAGYSAYFVELSREIQDEIIGRTEHIL
ncbi:glycyl radical protein [Chloroflexota bacterium]